MSTTPALFGREMIANPYPVDHRLRSMAPLLWTEPLRPRCDARGYCAPEVP